MSVRRARSNGVRDATTQPNKVRQLREEQLLTKAELSRKAGISPLTLTRIEGGRECRVDTKRKIILALGLTPSDRAKVFGARRGRT
jgi:DNA-binding XRE family transcriptional regulator